MTFKEYLKQKDPKRNHGVSVTTNDCTFIQYYKNEQSIVTLDINGSYYDYRVPKELGLNLRTVGCDRISCFKWDG